MVIAVVVGIASVIGLGLGYFVSKEWNDTATTQSKEWNDTATTQSKEWNDTATTQSKEWRDTVMTQSKEFRDTITTESKDWRDAVTTESKEWRDVITTQSGRINSKVDNIGTDIKKLCMHFSNLAQLLFVVALLFVSCIKLYENNDLNIFSLVNFWSYIALIGILIQWVYSKLSENIFDFFILHSFFMIITFLKLIVLMKSSLESSLDVYYISLLYHSFSINIPNRINIQILYCFIDICFYISIIGIFFLFINGGITSDYIQLNKYGGSKDISLIRMMCIKIIQFKFFLLLSQLVYFILRQPAVSVPYQILTVFVLFVAIGLYWLLQYRGKKKGAMRYRRKMK